MKKFFSFLLILMGLSIVFTACKDDEIALMSLDEGRGSELDGETTTPGALQRGEDGLWRATERVPLVGAGRVVDKISPALVAVAASQSGFNKIVDAENLNDYATLSGLSANLLAPTSRAGAVPAASSAATISKPAACWPMSVPPPALPSSPPRC